MECREFRDEFWRLRRREFIHSRPKRRVRVGGGDSRRLSREGPIQATESAHEKTGGPIFGRSVRLSSDCERQALHPRPRNVVGLRYQGESLVSYRKNFSSQSFNFNSFSLRTLLREKHTRSVQDRQSKTIERQRILLLRIRLLPHVFSCR